MRVFQGTVVHAPNSGGLLVLEDHLLGVNHGKVQFLVKASEKDSIRERFPFDNSDVTHLQRGELLLPGFVDSHIHASQYPNAGKALELPLLEWLERYTFPTEAAFADTHVAQDVYRKVVSRVLQNGTTTACYFATIHTEASLILADAVEAAGQRAYIGKVNMDQNAPDSYREDPRASVADTESFIKKVREKQNPLIEPVVTPRFAPCASEYLMSELGRLVKQYNVPVQSHVSETKAECAWVKGIFPTYTNYVDIYRHFGLLTDKSVLAHGIYLDDQELEVLRETGTGISHCPNSNLSIRSGLCDVARLEEHGVKVGLGTDVSGGYSPSMLDAMRHAIQVANVLAIESQDETGKSSRAPMDFRRALRLATLGGAQVLGLDDKIGNFEEGKEFDALVVSMLGHDTVDLFDEDSAEDILQKFIFLGDDRDIKEVYVAGQQVV